MQLLRQCGSNSSSKSTEKVKIISTVSYKIPRFVKSRKNSTISEINSCFAWGVGAVCVLSLVLFNWMLIR